MRSVTKGIADGDTIFVPLERIKNIGKTPKSSVPVLSAAKPWSNQGFCISGQFLWSSRTPMQLGAWRLRPCISRGAPKSIRFSSRAGSPKHRGFACSGTAPVSFPGGGKSQIESDKFLIANSNGYPSQIGCKCRFLVRNN
jgi:hypothetical protein